MFKKPKPSEYLRRHLSGKRFALDDLMSRHDADPDYADVIAAVEIIYATDDGRAQFEALIEKLEAQGR